VETTLFGGGGELLHKNQGVVSFENLTGKYAVMEVQKNLFNDRVGGYRLQLIDTNLRIKSAASLKKKLMDANRPASTQ
jgi:hypothetical protein